MALKERLEKARQKKKITRNRLAKLSQVEHATIYRVESGQQKGITPDTAEKLADVLDITASELLGIR